MTRDTIAESRALWNRKHGDLGSDEVLAQLLDRGDVADWAILYRLAGNDPDLRRRIKSIVATVPLPFPHFWLAALASLGETVDYDVETPSYFEHSEP
jgi:hypothetical protein